jgi:energy-coupling factor transporter transmembrane protein EcfT
MWLLNLLPDGFFIALALLGVLVLAAFLLRYIPLPFLYVYKTPIQLGSIALIIFSTFMAGVMYNEGSWQAKIKEMEEKVKIAEEQSKQKNVQIEEKVVYKDRVIKEKGQEIIKYVDRYKDREVLKEIPGPERVRVEEVIKYVESCPVPKELLDIHNQAATMKKREEKK